MTIKEKISDHTAEPILLAMIDEYSRLPEQKHNRYWELRVKCDEASLTYEENQEYELLIQEWEARNVKRVQALIALAKKRGTTLRGVMAQLGIKGT